MKPLSSIEGLEKLVEASNRFWAGKPHVQESELLDGIQQLRAEVTGTAKADTLLPVVDGLERLVLDSKKTWSGKRIINELEFFTQIEKIRWIYSGSMLVKDISTNPSLIIDEIEQLVKNGKGWRGHRVINEEEFFTHIQDLRSALSESSQGAHVPTEAQEVGLRKTQLLDIINAIEQLVESSKAWTCWRLVKEEEFHALLQRLRSALPLAIKEADS